MSEEQLTTREERRYKAHLSIDGIGKSGQEKLKNARVLVIGAGGKGTTALKNLMTAGVGNIGVSDDSLVKEETLSRQSLFGDNDIGKQKAIVSKQYLQTRNQFTKIKVHNIRLSVENLVKISPNYDVIVDATNDYQTHFDISEAALKVNMPLVFGTIVNNKAVITLLNAGGKKKLVDLCPNKKPINLGNSIPPTPTVIINSLTGILLANEAIKLILGQPTKLIDNMLIVDPNTYSLNIKPI